MAIDRINEVRGYCRSVIMYVEAEKINTLVLTLSSDNFFAEELPVTPSFSI